MMMTRTTRDYLLGIYGVADPLRTLARGNLYVLLAENEADALRAVLPSAAADTEPPLFLLLEQPDRAVLKKAAAPMSLSSIRAFAAAPVRNLRGRGAGLVESARSLYSALSPGVSSAVLSFGAESALMLHAEELARVIADCAVAAQDRALPILIIFYGETALELSGALMRESAHLSGLALLYASEKETKWRTVFWHVPGFHSGESEMLLSPAALPAGGFKTLSAAKAEDVSGDDDFIWSAAPILEYDEGKNSPVHPLGSNAEVFERGLMSTAATLVFRIDQPSDIKPAAKMIAELRTRRGRLLKIAVCAVGSPLRASSEAFLLACGANLLFEPKATAGHVRVMLSSLSGVTFPHAPPADFDALARSFEVISVMGLQAVGKFLELAENAVRSPFDRQDMHGAFVLLEPDPSLTAEEAMTQFAPRRSGDIGAVLGNRGVVFLSGCHPSYVELSLQRTFLLDPALLFHSYHAAFDDRDVLALIARCRAFLAENRTSKNIYDRRLPRRPADAAPQPGSRTTDRFGLSLMKPNPITPVRCKSRASQSE